VKLISSSAEEQIGLNHASYDGTVGGEQPETQRKRHEGQA
jgi:hypothetical protein